MGDYTTGYIPQVSPWLRSWVRCPRVIIRQQNQSVTVVAVLYQNVNSIPGNWFQLAPPVLSDVTEVILAPGFALKLPNSYSITPLPPLLLLWKNSQAVATFLTTTLQPDRCKT